MSLPPTTPLPILPSLYGICSVLLASQYSQPNILKIIASICGASDTDPLTLQNTFYATANQPYTRMISYAEGVQLDGIGDIVGLKRLGGLDDDTYRQLLIGKIATIRSSGTFEQVYDAVATVATSLGTGNTPKIQITERFPLSIEVVIFELFENLPSAIASSIQGACATPVSLSVLCTNAADPIFTFGGATETFTLYVNGAELIVNDTYSIDVTITSRSLTDDEGFGFSRLASLMQ